MSEVLINSDSYTNGPFGDALFVLALGLGYSAAKCGTVVRRGSSVYKLLMATYVIEMLLVYSFHSQNTNVISYRGQLQVNSYVGFLKYLECFCRVASVFIGTYTNLLFIDLTRVTAFLPIRKIYDSGPVINIAIGVAIVVGLLSASLMISFAATIRHYTSYCFIGSDSYIGGIVIAACFNWPPLAAFVVMTVKWIDYVRGAPLKTVVLDKEPQLLSLIKLLALAFTAFTLAQAILFFLPIVNVVNVTSSAYTSVDVFMNLMLPLLDVCFMVSYKADKADKEAVVEIPIVEGEILVVAVSRSERNEQGHQSNNETNAA